MRKRYRYSSVLNGAIAQATALVAYRGLDDLFRIPMSRITVLNVPVCTRYWYRTVLVYRIHRQNKTAYLQCCAPRHCVVLPIITSAFRDNHYSSPRIPVT